MPKQHYQFRNISLEIRNNLLKIYLWNIMLYGQGKSTKKEIYKRAKAKKRILEPNLKKVKLMGHTSGH